MKVLVIGRNKTQKWTDKEGVTRYTTEVIAEKIEFQAWPKRVNDAGGANDPDDEIPF